MAVDGQIHNPKNNITMKALQIIKEGEAAVKELAAPSAKAGEVLLRIGYVGFCGSDLNTFRGLNPLVKLPIIPGHEIGATVEAVGEGVPDSIKPGMNVTVNPYTSCGHCPACDNRRPNACRDNETLGVQRNGAMAEYIAVPWQKVILAEGLSLKELALVEPMSVGFHAVDRAAVTDSDTVMVIGCGMIGVGAIVRASLRGATVIAADVDDTKLELARKLGATHTINTATQEIHTEIMSVTDGRGCDVVIEAVGRPETYNAAIAEVAFTGRVVYIGYAKERVSFDTSCFVKKELDIRGSRNAMPDDFKAVIKYLQRGVCPVGSLISGVVKPEKAREALKAWSGNPGRVFRILVEL